MHLHLSLSYHGYGHIAQASQVVNALRRRLPALRLRIQCAAPRELLARWFEGEFDHERRACDFGMLMDNALDVRREPSLAAYREFHAAWAARVAQEAAHLQALAPDLVLSNIAYLPLAAAREAGLRAAALCSLNWADILEGYCAEPEEFAPVLREMRAAYRGAELFIQPTPHMPMPGLDNARTVGPIARIGTRRRAQLRERIGLPAGSRVVILGLGGIPTELPIDAWPVHPGLFWLVPDDWICRHPHAIPFARARMSFIDLLASSDALLTKPGYGSIAEAVCNGVPVLYLRRRDWPEEPHLVAWLKRHGVSAEIERAALLRGELIEALQEVLGKSPESIPAAGGAEEAAELLARKD